MQKVGASYFGWLGGQDADVGGEIRRRDKGKSRTEDGGDACFAQSLDESAPVPVCETGGIDVGLLGDRRGLRCVGNLTCWKVRESALVRIHSEALGEGTLIAGADAKEGVRQPEPGSDEAEPEAGFGNEKIGDHESGAGKKPGAQSGQEEGFDPCRAEDEGVKVTGRAGDAERLPEVATPFGPAAFSPVGGARSAEEGVTKIFSGGGLEGGIGGDAEEDFHGSA
ncbi:MAG: hypothetical protein RLZZ142_1064 [Verrucomicrobiota bacterium]